MNDPRPVRVNDKIKLQPPLEPYPGPWFGGELETWEAKVVMIFDTGSVVVDTPHGAYVTNDLTIFRHADGAPIIPDPRVPCIDLRGGCARNPLGECTRCGDV